MLMSVFVTMYDVVVSTSFPDTKCRDMTAYCIAKSISFWLSTLFPSWVCIFFVMLRYVSARDMVKGCFVMTVC